MPWGIIAASTFGLVLLLIFSGMPVALALGLGGILSAYFFLGNLGIAGYVPWQLFNGFILTAIPLFVFMGEILLHGKFTGRLYDGSTALVGRLRGGLLHANIFSCAIFAAISGSSVATAATMGTIAIPELEKRGYDIKITLGSLAAGGTLGILIPPSIPLIIYGLVVEESIGRLFIAGIFPGLMLAALFMLYIWVRVVIRPGLAPSVEKLPLKRKLATIKGMWPIIVIMVMILGGIYLGVMTPTEAAACGASLALIFTITYRRMTRSVLMKSLLGAIRTSTMLLFIIMGANIIAGTLGVLGIPLKMATWVTALGFPPLGILLLIYLMYLFLGCFFEGISMMVLTLSIVFPIIVVLGYDPIWFGIALVVLMEIAALTPPVGLNLYTIHGLRPDRPLIEVIAGSLPFFLLMLAGLAIITAFPIIATFLPSTMMKVAG